MNGTQSGFHFCWRVPETRRYSRILVLVRRSNARHNPSFLQSLNRVCGREPIDFKADHSSGKIISHRRLQPDAGHFRQAFLAVSIKLMNPRRDLAFSDLHVKAKGLRQGPTVLESMESAGCHPGCWIELLSGNMLPQAIHRRNGCDHAVPSTRVPPYQSSAPRPKEPLMAAGDEKITPQVGDCEVLYTETM